MALKDHGKRVHNALKEVAWVIAVVVGLALVWQHFHEETVEQHTMMME